MATSPTCSIVELPKPPRNAEPNAGWLDIPNKFRKLRLRSLEVAPEAFASTFEAESQYGHDQTIDRLSNSKAWQFVAVKAATAEENLGLDHGSIDGVIRREWLGMIVLLGPMEAAVTARADPFKNVASRVTGDTVSAKGKIAEQQGLPVEFVLNGVFVERSARGSGVGRALIDTAVEKAKGLAGSDGAGSFVTVLVSVENVEARKLYEKVGFVVVGDETYTQKPRMLLGETQAADKVALKMRKDIM